MPHTHGRFAGQAGESGSTLPLILGFFLLALLITGGAVAAGQAYVHQRELQQDCDGAAAALGASAVGLDREATPGAGDYARLTDVDTVLHAYLARDAGRRGVKIVPGPGDDGTLLTLHCTETRGIAFGAMFGMSDGVRHSAFSSVRAHLEDR